MRNTPTMKAELQGKEYVPQWGKELIEVIKSIKEDINKEKQP